MEEGGGEGMQVVSVRGRGEPAGNRSSTQCLISDASCGSEGSCGGKSETLD